MKRLLSLCLIIVMLLGIVPSVTAAEQTNDFTQYALALRESIAITFKIAEADLPAGATKVEFWKKNACVQEVAIPEQPKADGYYWFICNKIAPHEMDVDITAKLYVGEEVVADATKKVTDYCADVLGDANAAQDLKKLVVDMLHYGAASQAYVGDSSAKVNAGLTAEQLALGSDTTVDPVVTYVGKQSVATGAETVTWNEVSLTLGDSVMMTFTFTAETVEGLSVALSCGENDWVVDEFKSLGNNLYSFNFVGLNPAMMREEVEAVIKSGDTAVSTTVTYSIASYASKVMGDANASAELKALVKAMIRYGDSAAAYVETPDAAHRYDENGRCTTCEKAHFTAGKNVYIETESVDLLTKAGSDPLFTEAPLVVETGTKWSGSTAIRSNTQHTATTGFEADAVPHISFTVTPEKDGTYYIWVRGNATTSKFKYFVDDDNDTQVKYEATAAGSDGTTEKWFCLPKSFTWTTGNDYMVRFRVHNTLVRLDQFIVTSDANFDPATHTHTNGTDVAFDGTGHWYQADCCYGVKTDVTAHTIVDSKCFCGYEMFKQVIQAEDTNLMLEQDTTVSGTTNPPVKVYEITATSGKASETGNVVRTYVGNTGAQADDAPAHLSFEVTPEEDGKYYVWIKYYLAGSDTAYTTVHQKVEGVHTSWTNTSIKPGTGFILKSNANYGWFKLSTADWKGGETYTIGLRSRTIALYIDEFVITNDSNYTPS